MVKIMAYTENKAFGKIFFKPLFNIDKNDLKEDWLKRFERLKNFYYYEN